MVHNVDHLQIEFWMAMDLYKMIVEKFYDGGVLGFQTTNSFINLWLGMPWILEDIIWITLSRD